MSLRRPRPALLGRCRVGRRAGRCRFLGVEDGTVASGDHSNRRPPPESLNAIGDAKIDCFEHFWQPSGREAAPLCYPPTAPSGQMQQCPRRRSPRTQQRRRSIWKSSLKCPSMASRNSMPLTALLTRAKPDATCPHRAAGERRRSPSAVSLPGRSLGTALRCHKTARGSSANWPPRHVTSNATEDSGTASSARTWR